MDPQEIEATVRMAVEAVRARGDAALIELTERWDRVKLAPADLRVPRSAIEKAPPGGAFEEAFRRAVERIRAFHEAVKPRSTTVEDAEGVRMGLRWTPIESVGLYVPGGKASYPSSLAMMAIPARIAGVRRIAVVSPPGPGGEVSAEVLLAARVLGLDEIYRVGGAQAIAALALGTESIPAVDKIFGPGNAYVAEAKKQLFGEVGIDLLAGPSEIVVVADHTADPEWVAADLMAQAEHDESTRVTLLASSEAVLAAVRKAIAGRLPGEPRRAVIEASLDRSGRFEVAGTAAAVGARIDEIAPEHLSLQVEEPARLAALVRNAGAIFLGPWSPVAAGDYYAGPNHVLPTGRAARYASCLSTEDFMKRSNVVEMNPGFLARSGEDIETLALGERLGAHAASIEVRLEGPGDRARRGVRNLPEYVLVDEDAAVKLNQNESPWDIPEEVKDEVGRRLKDLPWNRYHQRIPQQFLAAVARDAGVPEECALAGSGSNLVLQWILEACLRPGATLLHPAPSFGLYPLWGTLCEARIETVPLGPRFEYDPGRILEAVRTLSPAVTILCLPNNPTGSELATGEVRRIAEAAGRRGGVLVVDEAYREFTDPELDRTSLARDLENVILVRTCSKAFSAAGMRIGYALASRRLAGDLRKMVPPFHLNLFAAVLGLVLWEKKDLFLERVRKIVAERERLAAGLASLPGVEVFPSHANFLLVRVADADGVFHGLEERGILVRKPGKETALAGCLRINVGTPEEDDRLLRALAEIQGGDRKRK